ncbi:MAG: phosphodiester glycosidase family protein [Clostridia bacterium]|nr:phosphodiester glycosidase family protein [Clostridia bacterium]
MSDTIKRILNFLLALVMLCACAHADEPAVPDGEAEMRERFENSLVIPAVKNLCDIFTDRLGKRSCGSFVKQDSPAWDALIRYDDGYFQKTRSGYCENISISGWVKTSDTTFECDAHATSRVILVRNAIELKYECGYHLCFEKNTARRDKWYLTDFSMLPSAQDAEKAERLTRENEGISVYPYTGKCFSGYMMVIDDPSRVFVGVIDKFSNAIGGLRIDALADKYGAVAAINGGCFQDGNGISSGGVPVGYLVSEGRLLGRNIYTNDWCNIVMGFTADDTLVVGRYQDKELEKLELRDALAFYPVLLRDGKKVQINFPLAYTARSAIGQDAEGRVLMFTAKGRQPDSPGASLEDLQEVMLYFGAVTAGNLDGGSSATMYLNGESVYSGYPLDVSRQLPAVFLVRPVEK